MTSTSQKQNKTNKKTIQDLTLSWGEVSLLQTCLSSPLLWEPRQENMLQSLAYCAQWLRSKTHSDTPGCVFVGEFSHTPPQGQRSYVTELWALSLGEGGKTLWTIVSLGHRVTSASAVSLLHTRQKSRRQSWTLRCAGLHTYSWLCGKINSYSVVTGASQWIRTNQSPS